MKTPIAAMIIACKGWYKSFPADAVIMPASPLEYVQKGSPFETKYPANKPPASDIKKFIVIYFNTFEIICNHFIENVICNHRASAGIYPPFGHSSGISKLKRESIEIQQHH